MKSFFLSYKTIKWLAILALIALLVPMLWLGFYATPMADDFSFGAPAHRAWVESGSFLAALAAACSKVGESYMSWQGTYSAIFLMAMQPAVFSEGIYWMTSFIMVFALAAGTFLFCRAFFSRLLGLDKHFADIIATVLLLLSTQLLPSAVQAFYWFNGSVYYVFYHGLMLAAIALGIRLVLEGGRGRMLTLCLACLMLGGGNYVTALTSSIIWAFALIYIYDRDNFHWRKLLVPGLLLLSGFGLSILAPGNAGRQASQWSANFGPVESVLLSFKNCIEYSIRWMELPVLGALLFIAVLSCGTLKNSSFKFRFPGLVTVFSYCLVSAMFCPPIYAMGNIGEERILNIIFFTWLLAMAVNVVWWLGWFLCRKSHDAGRLKLLPLVLACTLLLTGFALPVFSGRSYTSLMALSSLRSGEAKAWHDCFLRRLEVLNDESIKDARIEPMPCQPYLLCYSDIVDDPEAWENVDMASFYGKDSITFNTLD